MSRMTAVITFKASIEEKLLIEEAARTSGMKTGQFIRETVCGRCRKSPKTPKDAFVMKVRETMSSLGEKIGRDMIESGMVDISQLPAFGYNGPKRGSVVHK